MPEIVSPEGILITHSLFEKKLPPKPKPNSKESYFLRIGFLASAIETDAWQDILRGMSEVAQATWGAKSEEILSSRAFQNPLRDDAKLKGWPDYIHIWIGGSTFYPPAVVSRYLLPDGKTPKPIKDAREIYPGIRGKMLLSVRAFGNLGGDVKPGMSLDLRAFQKTADTEDGLPIKFGSANDGSAFGGEPEPDAAPFTAASVAAQMAETAKPATETKPAAETKLSPNLMAMLAGNKKA